jgi:hypothetical protein
MGKNNGDNDNRRVQVFAGKSGWVVLNSGNFNPFETQEEKLRKNIKMFGGGKGVVKKV